MHIPVLLKPILEILKEKKDLTIIDGTFGQGGYSREFLEMGHKVIAFDRDPEAEKVAAEFKAHYGDRFIFHRAEFSKIDQYITEPVDIVVFDLGVSSPQIDQPERGFSVRFDGPLDMRMSQTGMSAQEVVNTYSAEKLADIIYTYGEDRDSRRIARLIVKAREINPIKTTLELSKIIIKVNPNPKKAFDSVIRAFQAIRIYVNNELEELEKGLNAAGKVLNFEGLLMVVSFHSLEDRIVKDFVKKASGPLSPSRYAPIPQGSPAKFQSFGRNIITPDENELHENPRSRSAKLRVAIRTDVPWEQEKSG